MDAACLGEDESVLHFRQAEVAITHVRRGCVRVRRVRVRACGKGGVRGGRCLCTNCCRRGTVRWRHAARRLPAPAALQVAR